MSVKITSTDNFIIKMEKVTCYLGYHGVILHIEGKLSSVLIPKVFGCSIWFVEVFCGILHHHQQMRSISKGFQEPHLVFTSYTLLNMLLKGNLI